MNAYTCGSVDCIHAHACRRMRKRAKKQTGTDITMGCWKETCTAYCSTVTNDEIEEATTMAIEWVKRGAAAAQSKDVSVSLGNQNGERKRVTFYFRNGAERKVTKTGYIGVGHEANRVYFVEASEEDGFSVTQPKQGNPKTSTSDRALITAVADKCGEYDLMYDDIEGAYYVQLVAKNARR